MVGECREILCVFFLIETITVFYEPAMTVLPRELAFGGFPASEIMGQKGFSSFGHNVYTLTCDQTLSFIHPLSTYQINSSLRY